jgi:diguanylate cyclase (GGDEF)-like protein
MPDDVPNNLPEHQLAAQLMTLVGVSQQGFGLFDVTDTLCYANAAFRTTLGLEADAYPSWVELMRQGYARSHGTMIDTRDFETWLTSARSRRGKLPYRMIETEMFDGRKVVTTETTLPGGSMLCVITDVSELSTDWRQLRQQRDTALKDAMSDPLTGLSNRRYLTQKTEALLDGGAAAALAILDLDFFKRINDSRGHDVGDLIIKHFAGQLQTHARRDDLAGRLGGEEFLLVMPGATPEVAGQLLDRLLAAVRASAPLEADPAMRYTCSAGVAYSRPNETMTCLLQRADAALYRPKAEGRDRYLEAG